MCGIAGIWHLDGSKLEIEKVKKFTDSMFERGPDGAGHELYCGNTLGLGHRRLSILDLSEAGHQPMSYADGRYHITYNGEVFNFPDLRHELEQKGHKFKSDTDTEVILAAYTEWGPACLNRFNGMWAMAIWDESEQTLFLARDRFGIKPFYYYHQPGKMLAFASETRAFKSLDGFNRSLNEKLVRFQASGMRIHGSGYSVYNEIYSILPGHFAIVTKEGALKQKRWWHIRDHIQKDIPVSLKDQAEHLHELLSDACKIRLVSDVKVATALSGGLDSSAVYSLVYGLLKGGHLERVPDDAQGAVVATFPGLASDERVYAEKALSFTGGSAIFLPQEYPDLQSRLVKDTLIFDGLNEGPITAISGIYRGMKAAGITVSMDGHGVDEMLYGYRDMMYNLFDHYYKSGDLKKASMLRDVIVPTYAEHDQGRVEGNLQTLMNGASGPMARIKSVVKKLIGKNALDRTAYNSTAILDPIGEPYDFSKYSYPDRIIYGETFVETLPDIFRNFDLAGMMNSVEIRMPFMDWRVVSYLFSLPIESKIGNGYNKFIVREAMKGRMAEEIRLRRLKIGISSPVVHWFNTDLKEWVSDLCNSASFRNNMVLGKNHADAFLKESSSGDISEELVRQIWKEVNLHIITKIN